MKLSIYIERTPWADEVLIYIKGREANGKKFIVKPIPLVLEERQPDGKPLEPTIRLDGELGEQFMPALLKALAHYGLKTDAGELASMKYHLEDMRSLVFKTVPPER